MSQPSGIRTSPRLNCWRVCLSVVFLSQVLATNVSADEFDKDVPSLLRTFCFECHGKNEAEANVNLEQMASVPDISRQFKTWGKVVGMLNSKRMPPDDATQPSDLQRKRLTALIRGGLDSFVRINDGDPGRVVMRRMTSAEYAYTVEDLTGLRLGLERTFVNEAAGGEGFTNVGDVQFIQDSTLERYLEAAKIVASHAVIGSGPLQFYLDPGKTGLELSAINRVQSIYRAHGFRTAAGEGAEPFGLDLYPRAFFVAWQYRNRVELQRKDVSLRELARKDGLSVRFCEHIWNVVNSPATSFPLTLVVSRWQSLPAPGSRNSSEAEIRAACEELGAILREWQSTLAAAAGDEEEASVLTAGDVVAKSSHSFTADINWPEKATLAEFELSVTRASDRAATGALVVWRNARLRFRSEDQRRGRHLPLVSFLTPETVRLLTFGKHPAGAKIGENDFVIGGGKTVPIKLLVPERMVAAQLFVDVELDVKHGANRIVRCRIADGEVEGETAAEVGATSTLLADPASKAVAKWRDDVAEFARFLPEVSHREPAPSDRDPIPAPFDNAYNKPERNLFHYVVKYHRDDDFLVKHVLDDATRERLDHAWTDLLTSFEYYDANLRFAAKKFGINLGDAGIAELDAGAVTRFPDEKRVFIQRLRDEYNKMQQELRAAETGHVDDAIRLAERAWRRPLTSKEQQRLRAFYEQLRGEGELDHTKAMRALLARILVAPAFLYRVESPSEQTGIVPLSDWELANRLSFFLWSSVPDEELRRAAAAGELRDRENLSRQTRRMLRDPKARRLAVEFFGQWFGFYRFDEYRGVDPKRFPEFTDELKAAIHEEAISFFEYIVREDRPVSEILFADYTFLNRKLAAHYGIRLKTPDQKRHRLVTGVSKYHRGGLTQLAAILTVTSAPLRTSAVKRGDWILRRVIGTPVPPPPADAGSIAGDDAFADGLTMRQRLEVHRRDAACAGCHSRIDPLGFALEHYDAIGRWRDKFRDGKPIDSTGVLSDGTKISGPDGLRKFLKRQEKQFHRTLCAKLLGYAFGRTELASDRPLIDNMLTGLQTDGQFSKLIVSVVTSRQFRHQRGRDAKETKHDRR